jgi:hypothetical protein
MHVDAGPPRKSRPQIYIESHSPKVSIHIMNGNVQSFQRGAGGAESAKRLAPGRRRSGTPPSTACLGEKGLRLSLVPHYSILNSADTKDILYLNDDRREREGS